MLGLEITVAVGCPINCSYCPQSVLKKAYSGPQMLNLEDYRVALSKVPANRTIFFAGFCEPFIHSDIVTMIEEAVKGHKVIVNTTGTMVNADALKRLRKLNFYAFNVHLRPGLNTLNLRRLLSSRIQGLAVRYHQKPDDELLELHPAKKAGLHSRAGNLDLYRVEPNIDAHPCVDFGKFVLLPSGDVQLCCMDYGLVHTCGNLLTGTWDDLTKWLRNNPQPKLCQTCGLRK